MKKTRQYLLTVLLMGFVSMSYAGGNTGGFWWTDNPFNCADKELAQDIMNCDPDDYVGGETEVPVEPETPTEPEVPVEPETPTTPTEPETPTTPTEPETPTTPTEPETPTTPTEPEVPVEPELPTTPTEPEDCNDNPEMPTTEPEVDDGPDCVNCMSVPRHSKHGRKDKFHARKRGEFDDYASTGRHDRNHDKRGKRHDSGFHGDMFEGIEVDSKGKLVHKHGKGNKASKGASSNGHESKANRKSRHGNKASGEDHKRMKKNSQSKSEREVRKDKSKANRKSRHGNKAKGSNQSSSSKGNRSDKASNSDRGSKGKGSNKSSSNRSSSSKGNSSNQSSSDGHGKSKH